MSQELDAGAPGPRLWTPDGAPVIGGELSLQLLDGPPSGLALLLYSPNELPLFLPDLGATLFTAPPLGFEAQSLDADGHSAVLEAGTVGAGLCGVGLVAQAIVAAPLAPGGLELSNALRLRPGVAGDDLFLGRLTHVGGSGFANLLADFDGDGLLDRASVGLPNLVWVGPGDGTGDYELGETYGMGSSIQAIDAADLNGDGRLELLASTQAGVQPAGLSVRKGKADGTFTFLITYPAGTAPGDFALGDLDGDLVLDAAVVDEAADRVGLLYGNGDATFAAPAFVDVAPGPVSVELADLDGDGDTDVVTTSSLEVTVLLADAGAYTATGLTAAGAEGLAVADGDGDGELDLLVVSSTDDSLLLFPGVGDGTFGTAEVHPVGDGPRELAVGDLDEDGRSDVVVTNIDHATFSILLGVAGGSLGPASSSDVVSVGSAPLLVDVDTDGHLDLYLDSRIVRGRGDGSLSVPKRFDLGVFPGIYPDVASRGEELAIEDVNGDGLPDVVTSGQDEFDEKIVVLLGLGGGELSAPLYSDYDVAGFVTVGDWNGDATPDLAVADQGAVFRSIGQGDGTFGEPQQLYEPAGYGAPRGLIDADMDGDGDPELITTQYVLGSETLAILTGEAGAQFSEPVHFPTLDFPMGLAAGDLDADGSLDLAVAGGDYVGVHLGNGDGTLGAVSKTYLYAGSRDVAFVDVDVDGDLDVVAACGWANAGMASLIGDGTGGLGAPVISDIESGGWLRVRPTELDGDGIPDLVVVDSWRTRTLRGAGDGTFSALTTLGFGKNLMDVAVGDVDVDGNADIVALYSESRDVAVLLNQLGE